MGLSLCTGLCTAQAEYRSGLIHALHESGECLVLREPTSWRQEQGELKAGDGRLYLGNWITNEFNNSYKRVKPRTQGKLVYRTGGSDASRARKRSTEEASVRMGT